VPVEAGPDWQRLLGPLVLRCTATPPAELAGLQQRLMTWARAGAGEPLEWFADAARDAPGGVPAAALVPPPRPAAQVVADAVLASILDRITTGRLVAGDRVTESSLSRAVHASRGHVREALLTLASNGLMELEPRRSARVPAPRVADVVETYAARRALGALLVRRAVHWAPGSLDPVHDALANLGRTAETGDAHATAEADMRFQDRLALSTGMVRIPPMFLAMSAQIRMFSAVLGVRYTYAIPAMVRDDTTLLRHVQARDEAAALTAWHAKMDDAVSYMVGQLETAPRPHRRPRA
jgi:DNA-binding GntR family transcriptional regulator